MKNNHYKIKYPTPLIMKTNHLSIKDPTMRYIVRGTLQKLNNHQLKAGGLELRTESPDTGLRPVEFSPQF